MKRSVWVLVTLVLLGLGAWLLWSRQRRALDTASAVAATSEPEDPESVATDPTQLGTTASAVHEAEDEPEPAPDSGEPEDPEPSAEDCALCLQTVCGSEVSAGGSVEAAQCLIPCEYWLPKEMCLSGKGPPPFYRGQPRPLCPGHERTKATLALVECGKACPCPKMRWIPAPGTSSSAPPQPAGSAGTDSTK